MVATLVLCNVVLVAVVIAAILASFARFQTAVAKMFVPVSNRIGFAREGLEKRMNDLSRQLEETRGNLRQEVTDRLSGEFRSFRVDVEKHLRTVA